MKRISLSISAFVLLLAPAALGQDQGGAPQRQVKQQQGVLQVGEITIVGRVQKPIAAVDVAKIQPKLTLAELRQPFLDRIEEAVHKDPF
ncbi:MAG TPA: hypothetical protein VKU41_29335 [Polyangiaceae bacterium]|nr:hypothetical protein [Polyangiaceae bacterium]